MYINSYTVLKSLSSAMFPNTTKAASKFVGECQCHANIAVNWALTLGPCSSLFNTDTHGVWVYRICACALRSIGLHCEKCRVQLNHCLAYWMPRIFTIGTKCAYSRRKRKCCFELHVNLLTRSHYSQSSTNIQIIGQTKDVSKVLLNVLHIIAKLFFPSFLFRTPCTDLDIP